MPSENEIVAELGEVKKSFNGREVDGKLIITFSITDETDGEYKYTSFEKVFDTVLDFNEYLEAFLDFEEQ